MRALLQRILHGNVIIHGEEVGRIGRGLCIFLGVGNEDTERDADYLAQKVVLLRIFEDDAGKMNRSLLETGGEALIVSQFTLYGDCAKGRRPSFSRAAAAEKGEKLYSYFVARVSAHGVKTATGKFQARMEVSITNDGPVTLMLESRP
ncbi:MAG: D-tyrosyl-tRNA(Tyr) deacylase [Deltaproteobacteria bacterium]|nr:D-tyrosyl-tRNA(Tyr) deacylase [Deltaproteobacteria bacterium]